MTTAHFVVKSIDNLPFVLLVWHGQKRIWVFRMAVQLSNRRNMNLQIIDIKRNIFLAGGCEYWFAKPSSLMRNFSFIEAKVKGSTMGWYINGGFLSYNQLREAFEKEKKKNLCKI